MGEAYRTLSEQTFQTDYVCDACGRCEARSVRGTPGYEDRDEVHRQQLPWSFVLVELPNGTRRTLLACGSSCEDTLRVKQIKDWWPGSGPDRSV